MLNTQKVSRKKLQGQQRKLKEFRAEAKHCLFSQEINREGVEYDNFDAMVLARLMEDLDHKYRSERNFSQQYTLNKGLKKFGKAGEEAAKKEMQQLHDRGCWTPVNISEMMAEEKRKAQRALAYLTQKKSGEIKGRTIYNGSKTREWLSKEDLASPTASLQSLLVTMVIDAYEGRDTMATDVPNAFIQAKMPEVKNGEERVFMKIEGSLVDILLQINPEIYGGKIVYENGKKVLYVKVLRAIYGMLIASLLWYRKFKKDLEEKGYVFNPYDPCVANKMINGKQHTVRFHVDDLFTSHEDSKVNDEFLKWLNLKYGEHGEVKATRGSIHEYLGMTLEFEDGELKINMINYVRDMLEEFPIKFKNERAISPATADMFSEDVSKKLSTDEKEIFHRTVAKALFLCKRARKDIQPIVSVLCTRVKSPGRSDWNKLVRMMKFLHVKENQ